MEHTSSLGTIISLMEEGKQNYDQAKTFYQNAKMEYEGVKRKFTLSRIYTLKPVEEFLNCFSLPQRLGAVCKAEGARKAYDNWIVPYWKITGVSEAQFNRTPDRHTHAFCTFMYEQSDIYPPPTWTMYTSDKTVKQWKVKESGPCGKGGYSIVDVDKDTFTAIERLVHGTWEPSKVGRGKDANGLEEIQYTGLKVTKIQRVENLTLYEKYINMQQSIFHKAGEGPLIKKMLALNGCHMGQPKTEQYLDTAIKDQLYDEVNETYLFHGTKADLVETLQIQGMDPRLGKGMLGGGIYMAESSTKSDQYADERESRRSKNLQMFLVRACLGNICMIAKPREFCRPPCTDKLCLSDKCLHDTHFDSVVEEGNFRFREFVVYEASLAYPEYVITYDRV